MDIGERYARLPGALLPWYADNQRDLPWRHDRVPYHVWLSEIMLQQTRVEAVKGYYARFLTALPTIADLAACPDDKLHKLWEGLGYYSRVRSLKKAAQVIMAQYGGVFPREYGDVLRLPGIGEYTAGAICSICFSQPTPAVDGNVMRCISRIMEDDTPMDLPAQRHTVRSALAQVYPPQAGEFTQALMELGATVCGPNRKPDCGRCPCADFCLAHLHGREEALPVKSPKRERKIQHRTVFILSCGGKFALEKRPQTGLLAGLWQFPNVPGTLDTTQALAWAEALGLHPRDILRTAERRHIFTHIQWEMTGYYLETGEMGGGLTWMTREEIDTQAALPTAFRIFWEGADYV